MPLGEAVGYAVRFNDRSREDTLLRLMTDGLLLAEIQSDRLLHRYDTIIIDEAHERSLNIDFLLGYLKRILPARPDLKVIITSATIDPERFAAHFGDAPIIEVSGRTFPVEVRYREPDEDTDQTDAIGDAVEELLRERPGDILVFLSGEREIRDTADALEGRLRSGVEILPLFARQSTAAQQRVWKPHKGRRVVLATNVAETSLTVPGIHYVVDPGFARISRYSARLKVQRLPIEPVSQASADQRKGRCGRTSDGIAIRLYSEEDFTERPRFTEPEILRTSLAAVILQMAAIDLGDVEDFPFLDPPDRRQVRDGIALLQELGALDESGRKLTPLGRQLAQLPIDPRMGRMVIEAERLGCVEEVIVIASALSIQDVRERPADQQAQADQAHARHADENSDFLAFWNLWRYLHERRGELSVNQFRKQAKSEFLHYLRIREWQDLVGQVRQAAKGVGIKSTHVPAEPEVIHQAILTGLLSHLGVRDASRRDYLGARGGRFALWPGSGLKGNPSWIMVNELIETSRLWGRTAAKIDPRWVEPAAEHLVRRTYDEPRWDRKRASVVAIERVTLYGLPVVAGRTVPYGKIDPALSRDLFLRRALVEGEWDTRHRFLAANAALVEEVQELEDRARRRDILVDDQALYDFYAARMPEGIVSGAHFDRWWRDERRVRPDLLTFTRELLINPAAAEDVAGRPDVWTQGDAGAEALVSLRAGQRARRRDRARAAEGAAAAAGRGVRVAGAGVAVGARRGPDPLPAQGAAQAARARAGDRREGARAARAAARAAVGGAGSGDRGPARRAHRGHRLGPGAVARVSEDDLQRRGRAGARDRLRPGPRRAARAGAAEAARRPGGRRRASSSAPGRRHGPSGRSPRRSRCRAPARPCGPTCRWSTRAPPWACGPWRAPRRSACTCGRACGGCWR